MTPPIGREPPPSISKIEIQKPQPGGSPNQLDQEFSSLDQMMRKNPQFLKDYQKGSIPPEDPAAKARAFQTINKYIDQNPGLAKYRDGLKPNDPQRQDPEMLVFKYFLQKNQFVHLWNVRDRGYVLKAPCQSQLLGVTDQTMHSLFKTQSLENPPKYYEIDVHDYGPSGGAFPDIVFGNASGLEKDLTLMKEIMPQISPTSLSNKKNLLNHEWTHSILDDKLKIGERQGFQSEEINLKVGTLNFKDIGQIHEFIAYTISHLTEPGTVAPTLLNHLNPHELNPSWKESIHTNFLKDLVSDRLAQKGLLPSEIKSSFDQVINPQTPESEKIKILRNLLSRLDDSDLKFIQEQFKNISLKLIQEIEKRPLIKN